ncbi:MAG: uroporphyrinogen decarboxylase family protein [Candidatus Helarchaeota archaeon]
MGSKYRTINNSEDMTALDRVFATISGEIPDRVPVFPLTTSISAELLNIDLPSLYQKGEFIFNGQVKFQKLIGHDFVTSFFYLVKDAEPWGAEPIFYVDGDPNLKSIPFTQLDDILNIEIPDVNSAKAYEEPKKTIKLFTKSEIKGKVPIIGVLTGPFSLPVFFFTLSKWLESLLIEPQKFQKVIEKIIPYVIDWANIQIELGVDMIFMVDGVVSTTVLPKDIFSKYVIPIYNKLTSNIKAPIILGSAGGEVQGIISEIIRSGVSATTLSSNDDLTICKKLANEKLVLMGNLNNIEFGDWSPNTVKKEVKKAIDAGTNKLTKSMYILMNQHNFPKSVTLSQIGLMVKFGKKFGKY